MGLQFINHNQLDVKIDVVTQKIQEKISRKIQAKLNKERGHNVLINIAFQHLTPKELIVCSLVSKKWYTEIGKLKTCSERIAIKSSADGLDVLEKSERYYKKIDLKVENTWWEIEETEKIIGKYSLHLKSLKLIKFGGFNSMLNDPLPFSRCLTEVELHAICGRLSGGFLKYVTSLRKLTVNGIDPEGFLCLLTKNSHLIQLILYESSFISYFESDFSSLIEFKLKKFGLFDHMSSGYTLKGEYEAPKWTKVMLKNIVKFLRTQSNLKSLHFDSCDASNLGKFIMSSVEILEINNLEGCIEDLNISAENNVRVVLTNLSSLNFFSKFPKLEAIFVKVLSSDMLFINYQNAKVREVYFEEQEDATLEWINCNSLSIEQLPKDEFKKLYCNLK